MFGKTKDSATDIHHATPLGLLAWHTHELAALTKRSRPTQLDSHLQTRGI